MLNIAVEIISVKRGGKVKYINKLLEYLEEVLIMLGFLFFIAFGYAVSLKIGLLITGIVFICASFTVIKFKKMTARG